jgi:hypothetical protein
MALSKSNYMDLGRSMYLNGDARPTDASSWQSRAIQAGWDDSQANFEVKQDEAAYVSKPTHPAQAHCDDLANKARATKCPHRWSRYTNKLRIMGARWARRGVSLDISC